MAVARTYDSKLNADGAAQAARYQSEFEKPTVQVMQMAADLSLRAETLLKQGARLIKDEVHTRFCAELLNKLSNLETQMKARLGELHNKQY